MGDERPLLDELLDYAVYAPLGLALTAIEELPALVEKGRSRLSGQIAIAKFVGNLALRSARRRMATPDSGSTGNSGATVTPLRTEAPASPDAGEEVRAPSAIPDYEELAASQIITRLAELDREELEAVARFEITHRARRTILNRISQLKG